LRKTIVPEETALILCHYIIIDIIIDIMMYMGSITSNIS